VPAGVQCGDFFAFSGPGTRGKLGVAAIGCELFSEIIVCVFPYSMKIKAHENAGQVLSR
jgi:hypothetical protein